MYTSSYYTNSFYNVRYMAILMKDYILTILWWAIILLLMPTILSFAMNPTEYWIIFLGIVVALAVPLTFPK